MNDYVLKDLNAISSVLKLFFRKLSESLFTDGKKIRPNTHLNDFVTFVMLAKDIAYTVKLLY